MLQTKADVLLFLFFLLAYLNHCSSLDMGLWTLNLFAQVHAADSLLKLVSVLKRTAIFSGLASLNESVDRRIEVLGQQAEGTERMLERVGQEVAASLKELDQC
jgi:hypothetical protein